MQAAELSVEVRADVAALANALAKVGVSFDEATARIMAILAFDPFDAYLMLDDPPDARVGPPTPSDGWVPSRVALSVTVPRLHRPARARGPPLAVRMT